MGKDQPEFKTPVIKPSPYEVAMGNIAKGLFNQSRPLRFTLENQFEKFLRGNYDVSKLAGYKPLYSFSRQGLEDQYKVARENTMASTPRGGALSGALKNVELERAQNVGMLPSNIGKDLVQNMMNMAYGTAYQTPQTALQGLSGAGSTYGSRQAAASNMANQMAMQNYLAQQQMYQGLGSGLGMLVGGLFK